MTTRHPLKDLTGWLLAALVAALFVVGAVLDGPSDIDAAQATQASTQDAINSVATSARVARAEAQMDAEINPLRRGSFLAQNTAQGAK